GLSWTYLNSTSSGAYFWNMSLIPSRDDYLINVRPYDTLHNATNATSHYFGIHNIIPSLFILNQTNSSNAILTSSNPLKSGSSLVINVNASHIYGIDSVWINFWGNGVNSASIWKTTLSRVSGTAHDGIWQIRIVINESFPEWGYANYTIYANDTITNTVSNNSNFSIVDNEYLCPDHLACEYTTLNDALSGENGANSTISVTGSNMIYGYTGSSGSYSLYPSHNRGAIEIDASNVTVDCGGSTIFGNHQAYGILSKGFNNITLSECRFSSHMIGLNISDSAKDHISFVDSYDNVNYGIYLSNFTNGNLNYVNVSNNTNDDIFMKGSN
ncbi:MAG: hypothetical protein NT001_01275, partial [Candidatus Woesearchaeota archaeon]|nr:hypothetical protein [Candidatus Woesearchaeota archaeon]